MRAYYDRRAAEYDDWWLGRGLYAERDRPGWHEEVERVCEVVHGLEPSRVLDVACGTGFLTQHLRGEVVGLDQSPAMVAVAAARLPGARIVQGDAVPLPFADGELDRVLHRPLLRAPPPRRAGAVPRGGRRVAGELVVVDSALRDGVEAEEWQERVLNDGTRHRVYKRYFTGAGLADELGGGDVLHDGRWFVVVAA